jgi:membrane fusion protein (multidrug efflux system)
MHPILEDSKFLITFFAAAFPQTATSPRKTQMDKTLYVVGKGPTQPETVDEAKTGDPSSKDAAPAGPIEVSGVSTVPKRKRRRLVLLAGGGIALLAAAAYYGDDYWRNGRFQIATDDAYVQADNSAIAPKVSGYLSQVLVGDNETVKAGQPLAKIDDRDFVAALDQATADVTAAQASVDSARASLDIQQSNIAAAKATVDVDNANVTFAEQNNKRYESLATNGYAAVQTAQQAAAQISVTQATVVRDNALLAQATKQIALLNAQVSQATAALKHDLAVQHQAELNVSYATVVAPVDGVVGNRTLRVGQYVQAGTQLMSVVPTTAAYVIANYKETQLTDVCRGQAVTVEVDMFPGRIYHGHVDSLAPASGQEFALLPPDNATGNFTKVVQRIPVKITLDPESKRTGDLRPGMSVEPSIDTKAQSQSND